MRMPASQTAHARVLARMPAGHDHVRDLARRELTDLLHYCRVERLGLMRVLAEARECYRKDLDSEKQARE